MVRHAGGFPESLVERLRGSYRLRWEGIHGWPHWVRVRENGLELAGRTGADAAVVEAFALLHDIARRNDVLDPGHGRRAAALLRTLDPGLLPLDEARRGLLAYACAHHTAGRTEGDVTVLTCWDADRLDLGRIGIRPDPRRLCTEAARDPGVIEWAWRRSRGEV